MPSKASEWAKRNAGGDRGLTFRSPEGAIIATVGWAKPDGTVIPILDIRKTKELYPPEVACALARWILDTFSETP
jgi:hypothetical protein